MNGTTTQSKNVYMVKTNIRKWGNSQGIRLSKELMSQMNLNENDAIGISVNDGKMTIEKLNGQKHFNLKERLEAFYNKPIDEVFVENTHEVDMGAPVGNEAW
jgi:antitoxin MazE